MKLNNKYYILRHGQAESNVKNIVSCWPEKFKNPLTKKGVLQIKNAAEELKNKNIDLIFTSPLLRAKQTAEIIGKEIKVKPKFDRDLREYNVGEFNGKPILELVSKYPDFKIRFSKAPKGGESYKEITKRMSEFLKKIDKKYINKNILIISHQVPLVLLLSKLGGLSKTETFEKYFYLNKIKPAEIRELN